MFFVLLVFCSLIALPAFLVAYVICSPSGRGVTMPKFAIFGKT